MGKSDFGLTNIERQAFPYTCIMIEICSRGTEESISVEGTLQPLRCMIVPVYTLA